MLQDVKEKRFQFLGIALTADGIVDGRAVAVSHLAFHNLSGRLYNKRSLWKPISGGTHRK